MSTRTTTACLIGVSGFANTHYTNLLRQVDRNQIRFLGATIINQHEEAEKCAHLRNMGCEIFSDYRDMIARFGGESDLCFIPTGIAQHAPMTIDALRAGTNVFVEKPAAATIQDVRAMQACERETGRFVAVGFQTIYARETLLMKRAILNGEIGEVQSIKCRGLWPRSASYYARNAWAGRLGDNSEWILDSPFNNAVAHQLNMLCFLAGTELTRPAQLRSVEAELYRIHDIESADTACLRVITETNLPLYFYATHSSATLAHPDILVRGSKGSIRWNFHHSTCIERADGLREKLLCESGEELRDSMVSQVCARVTNPDKFICDLDIAGTHTLCVNGAHESSRIHIVDKQFVDRIPEKDDLRSVLRGIEEVTEQALEQEKLYSELRIPWSQPATVVPMRNYSFFPRCSVASGPTDYGSDRQPVVRNALRNGVAAAPHK